MYVGPEILSKGQPSNMDLHMPSNTDMSKVELFRTQGTCNPSDWTSGEVFLNRMHFFVEQVRRTADKKFQDDVNIEDRPCTPKGFEITKETQENGVSATSPEPECFKTNYSPPVLRPIPQSAKPTTTRKWKLQRSTMLTSIPVKEEQKQKFKKAIKTAMKPLDDDSTKASQKTVKNTAKENKKKKTKKYDVSCIFCGEIYIEEDGQPTEN